MSRLSNDRLKQWLRGPRLGKKKLPILLEQDNCVDV